MTTRRQFIVGAAATSATGALLSSSIAASDDYLAVLDFDADTFTGTITEPDGTVNNLSGYHGAGELPPLGGAPSPSPADVVLSGVVDYPTGLTVPAGQVWEFDPNVDTTLMVGGSIMVHGTLRAAPGPTHTIRFYGIDESNVLGADNGGDPSTDIGIWVMGGVLDISGVPKVAWNRTGIDQTWGPTDELVVTPTDVGAYEAAPFTGAVSSASTDTLNTGTAYEVGYTYAAEVLNLSRTFTVDAVDGRAHIMFMGCTSPQRLEYVTLRRLGVPGKLGRYPLHVHMNGEGTNGSLFRGNVAIDCGNHAFVPHLSNGCDMSYSIAYRTTGTAFWWDSQDESERTIWNRCVAVETSGAGFMLGEGVGNSCVGSVAVGTIGNSSAGGFLWPSEANGDRNVWLAEDCVAHNNRTNGFRVWQNDLTPHAITRCVAYSNQREGFSQGAYNNRYRYFQCVGFANLEGDMVAHALGRWSALDCWVDVFRLVRHSQPSSQPNVIESSWPFPVRSIQIAEQAPGSGPAHGGTFQFISRSRQSDINPTDITVPGTQLSTIEVVNNKAPSFTLTPP